MKRCEWVTDDEVYISYHDQEWGVPKFGSRELFEFLCLESAQAGLSWLTILKKRENYRRAFDDFNPEIIAWYDEAKVGELMTDKGIVRNRLKINSVIKNVRALLEIEKNKKVFGKYIWEFTNGRPIQNHWKTQKEVPIQTEISKKMCKQLKKDGFSFVGPTICYSFMQAAGLVNDHLLDCRCYEKVKNRGDKFCKG